MKAINCSSNASVLYCELAKNILPRTLEEEEHQSMCYIYYNYYLKCLKNVNFQHREASSNRVSLVFVG